MAPDKLDHQLEKLSEADRRQVEQAQEMLGPDPATMGPFKNLFWGRIRHDALLPYPEVGEEERRRCDALLERLDAYLEHEHPAVAIDRDQEIPSWAIHRLFELGVMGMIIPPCWGGGGFSITSYNRVLERIGRTCASTAVMVSAHQSIGCGALIRFGTEEQKRRFLPALATDTLSAFCLSEPNVGCDAAGQETRCELAPDGSHYILNGEKKWATSGALSGLFTVMARQRLRDEATGEEREAVTALICTPDMPGVEIFQRNRSKCGIRGTWQARIRFSDVKVPRANLLHREGRGLTVALSCLNIGRCTLSAGMLGAARRAFEQALKWARYRYQFDRPIADFELVRAKLARMAAVVYAMDAVLYMTTGIVDRGDEDLMLETAACKVLCSDLGFRTVDDALQVMGGEGYMTENLLERAWRDSRIHIIVEGANEVMHSFLFGYGAKGLGEHLLEVRANPLAHLGEALGTATELLLGVRGDTPRLVGLDERLASLAEPIADRIRELSHQTKRMLARHQERLVVRQCVQERLSWAAIWLHAALCALARLDRRLSRGLAGDELVREMAVVQHLVAIACAEVDRRFQALDHNPDATMDAAAEAALARAGSLPNHRYAIPEKTPDRDARGTGRRPPVAELPDFGAGSLVPEEVLE